MDCTLNFDNIEPALCHLSEPPPPPKTVAYLFLPTQNLRKDTSKLFRVVERMPVFGDCNNEPSEQQRRSCSNQALLSFIFKHFRYPQLALETVIEGPVVIHFIIEKDGAMTNLEVIRDPGGDLGSEALRVATLMANRNTWIAGQQNEKPVRVEFNLPLRFHLED